VGAELLSPRLLIGDPAGFSFSGFAKIYGFFRKVWKTAASH
jgi:hypothetical protein